jgi:hypothetical protein
VAGELHNPKAILANSNKPYLVINTVLEQSSGLIFTCQEGFRGALGQPKGCIG